MSKIKRLDHIGIAVKDLDKSIHRFKTILGAELMTKTEVEIAGGKLSAAFLKLGDNLIVLDSSDDPKSAIARYVSKRGEGLHHLCFEIDDLGQFIKILEGEDMTISHEDVTNSIRKEIFIHPKDFCGILLQIIEWKGGSDRNVEDRIQRLIKGSKGR